MKIEWDLLETQLKLLKDKMKEENEMAIWSCHEDNWGYVVPFGSVNTVTSPTVTLDKDTRIDPNTVKGIKQGSSYGRLSMHWPIGNEKAFIPDDVVNVEFYPPAVKMYFKDGTVTVSTPHGEDAYDPEMGMIICILKYTWGDKGYNNFFKKWIKKDQKFKDYKKELDRIEKERKEDELKKAAKNAKRKEKRDAAKIEREIQIMSEAIKRANNKDS